MEFIRTVFTTSPLNWQLLLVAVIIIGLAVRKSMIMAANARSYTLLDEEEFTSRGRNKMIDVRMAQDYEFDHIKGAANIPSMEFRTKPITWPTNKEIFLYAYNEKGAASVARTLKKRGYNNVYVLKGGIVPFKGDTTGRLTKEMEIATPKGKQL